jgi:putative membrane protein
MRRVLLILGLVTLAACWLGPLPQMAQQAFFAHMTMHMGIVAVAAPLVALGIAGTQFDPVPKAPALISPIPASLLELVVVWAWHAPDLHHAARHHTSVLIAEQGMFLLTGLLLWLSAFGGEDRDSASRRASGVVGLLLTSMHMTLLGALLTLTSRPLYVHSAGFSSFTHLDDQHLGGSIMLIVGGISYLAGSLWLMIGLIKGTTLKSEPEPQ